MTKIVAYLPKKRLALQTEVRDLIKKYGPKLGDLYFENEVAWDQVMKKLREDDESKNSEDLAEATNENEIPKSVSFGDFSVSPDEPTLPDPDFLSKKMM
jgi:hypothetical protein